MDKDTRITIARLTLEDIKGITLTGNRWTDSLGVTYHSTYVACLVDVEKANELNANHYNRPEGEQVWIDVVRNEFMPGHGNQYEYTGYTIFREAVQGNFVDFDNVSVRTLYTLCNMLSIPYYDNCNDVKRKKDL